MDSSRARQNRYILQTTTSHKDNRIFVKINNAVKMVKVKKNMDMV